MKMPQKYSWIESTTGMKHWIADKLVNRRRPPTACGVTTTVLWELKGSKKHTGRVCKNCQRTVRLDETKRKATRNFRTRVQKLGR